MMASNTGGRSDYKCFILLPLGPQSKTIQNFSTDDPGSLNLSMDLKLFSDKSADLISLWEHQRVSYVNPAFAAWLELPARHLTETDPAQWWPLPQYQQTLSEHAEAHFESQSRAPNGRVRRISWRQTPLGPNTSLLLGRDLDPAVCPPTPSNAESEGELARLQHQIEALTLSNQDLEKFAYVASHDLQEPLRMVISFLQLLERKYRSQLDDTAQKYIDFASDGARRMKQLIEDLLTYSRLANAPREEFARVSLDQVFAQSCQTLQFQIAEAHAEIQAEALPEVLGHAVQLGQVLQNLLSNALKYRSPLRRPEIRVSAQALPDAWEITVSDNGIGIESTYYDQIFELFQRLHSRSEYAGTGIGLALCRKILQTHGGNIWVDSQPDVGSRFVFRLPRPGEAQA